MIELAQLFQDMEAAVVQQEAPIQHIDDKAENTVTHVQQGNTQLDGAVTKARSARKKKWICLGIGRTYLHMSSKTRNLLTLSKYLSSSSSSPQSSSVWLSRSENDKAHSNACIRSILFPLRLEIRRLLIIICHTPSFTIPALRCVANTRCPKLAVSNTFLGYCLLACLFSCFVVVLVFEKDRGCCWCRIILWAICRIGRCNRLANGVIFKQVFRTSSSPTDYYNLWYCVHFV